jgi:hypothetical protein
MRSPLFAPRAFPLVGLRGRRNRAVEYGFTAYWMTQYGQAFGALDSRRGAMPVRSKLSPAIVERNTYLFFRSRDKTIGL